ncbi:MAG: 1,4-alpha-glucan branching protein GlgB [Planctomycetes bacterium]|nr:1,4-alpha-glucan branching protein GlgB [Planctomycetota bacterium]
MPLPPETIQALLDVRLHDPFAVLGLHREGDQLWARVWLRSAREVQLVPEGGKPIALACRLLEGLFEGAVGRSTHVAYHLRVRMHGDDRWHTIRDTYGFWPQLPDFDLGLMQAGHHLHLGDILGAHAVTVDGCEGVRFAVWAPTASSVSVVGDWNGFDGRFHPMRPRPPYGVWELFIPGVRPGMLYKYEIRAQSGEIRIKADPCALQAEVPPATASVVAAPDEFEWGDGAWMAERLDADHLSRPMAIYECHLGSWRRSDGRSPVGEPDSWPNYRTLAQQLIRHCKTFGFTHIELLPVAQHPYEGSWGYQVTGQFAPNSRHGSPDDLRWFVDQFHLAGIGVIVDYVPGHFPKDDFALARFDGSPCYEYDDPREGEHKTWGTCVFNFRRVEVRNFLIAAALHWLRHYHIDGLRVDAVSSMLYRDYDRKQGEWIPNDQGGNANVEAVTFLQELTSTVHREFKGVLMIAEESTAWQGVTGPTHIDGLGFDLKWNMGWMHDTLGYLAQDPVMRSGCHNRITFHQWYAYDDKWVHPLSHDEVVHGKRSLIDKMPGDWWQRRAQLRLLFGYQVGVPGRILLFQGAEFGQGREWDWDRSVDWEEAKEPDRAGISQFLAEALKIYRSEPALHKRDDFRDGFQWVDCDNAAESVLAFLRKAPNAPDVLVACNFTPVPRLAYPLGVHVAGTWTRLLSSDEQRFGGSGVIGSPKPVAASEWRGSFPATIRIDLPPLGIVFLRAPMGPT